ncbi:MAG: YdeI/OmpD-associated family protein [Flavobacteriales bacterium]|nr:YdeI/OmpD-associated family protein [Flavobacteriales bacterium]
MNPKVDDFLNNVQKWHEELSLLRSIILNCGLVEDFKWMHPCYTYNKNNIVLIHGFKDYCAVLFHKGALLNDADKILIQQTENVQSGRQIRFTSTQEIIDLKATIKAYIFEAIEVEKAGLKVVAKKTEEFNVSEELAQKFNENLEFKKAFEALTPGRQRGYLLHFSGAKQAQTRVARIEKNMKRIFDGYGLNDCTCGLSKRKPNCDGSHKNI